MPFDPFFSSANKKYYKEVAGANELYNKIAAMPFEERYALIQEWKKRGLTPAEGVAISKLKYLAQGKRWAKIRHRIQKKVNIATEELKQGKRVMRVETNTRQFNTCDAGNTTRQKHSFRQH